ncbi:unnamed protein product [Prunus brigantina]
MSATIPTSFNISHIFNTPMDHNNFQQVRCLRQVNDELVNAQHQLHAKSLIKSRRMRIAERLDALRELLPISTENACSCSCTSSAEEGFLNDLSTNIVFCLYFLTWMTPTVIVCHQMTENRQINKQMQSSLTIKIIRIESRLYRVDLQIKSCLPPEMGVRIRFNNCSMLIYGKIILSWRSQFLDVLWKSMAWRMS